MVGAVVTGYGAGMSVPDWPTTYDYWFYPLKRWVWAATVFMEHGHRTLAQLVGVLAIALAAVVWRGDRRKWMRRLVADRGAGGDFSRGAGRAAGGGRRTPAGPRPRLRGPAVPGAVRGHGVGDLRPLAGRRRRRGTCRRTPAAPPALGDHRGIYLEIVLGTLLRVPSFAVGGNWFEAVVWAKLIVAGLIAAGLAWLWISGRSNAPARGMIAVRVRLLALVFLLQIVLAGGTWATHYGWPAWFTALFGTIRYTVVETGPWQVALTTLHVGVGSLSLAIASSITLWSYRLWREFAELKAYVSLVRPRIMAMVLLAMTAAAWIAAGERPGPRLAARAGGRGGGDCRGNGPEPAAGALRRREDGPHRRPPATLRTTQRPAGHAIRARGLGGGARLAGRLDRPAARGAGRGQLAALCLRVYAAEVAHALADARGGRGGGHAGAAGGGGRRPARQPRRLALFGVFSLAVSPRHGRRLALSPAVRPGGSESGQRGRSRAAGPPGGWRRCRPRRWCR